MVRFTPRLTHLMTLALQARVPREGGFVPASVAAPGAAAPAGWMAPLPRPRAASAGQPPMTKLQAMASDSSDNDEVTTAVAPDIVVFTRPGCLYCNKAKALLQERGMAYGVVDLGAQPERRREAREVEGSVIVPQVFVGRRYVGGLDALKELDGAGGLAEALRLQADDGAPIAPTSAEDVAAAASLPKPVRESLARRAEELASLDLKPGSRPRIKDFLRYAVTKKVNQDQSRNVPLNLAAQPGAEPLPPALPKASAVELASLLRQLMLHLIDTFSNPKKGTVDYASMKDSLDFGLFRALASELGHPRLREELVAMPEDEKKAFLINLYNAMTFHGVVAFGRRSGLWQLYCFYLTPAVSYSLAGAPVSLDDVENGMLRRQPGYFSEESSEAEFKRGMRMETLDARIHMALNCGARGCPPTAVYKGASIEAELEEATVAFVADPGNVYADKSIEGKIKVEMTELFSMYIADFAGEGANAKRLDGKVGAMLWALKYAKGGKRQLLEWAVERAQAGLTGDTKFKWIPYDWGTNGPDMPLDSTIYTPAVVANVRGKEKK